MAYDIWLDAPSSWNTLSSLQPIKYLKLWNQTFPMMSLFESISCSERSSSYMALLTELLCLLTEFSAHVSFGKFPGSPGMGTYNCLRSVMSRLPSGQKENKNMES